MADPELRVFRTFKWVRDPHQEVRYGGPPPHMLLVHTDELQKLVDGEWVPVPVVEADKPPHPHQNHSRRFP
jgi:hypothetical protein